MIQNPRGTIQDECFYLDLLGFPYAEIARMVTLKFKLPRALESHEVETLIEAENIHYYYASIKEPGSKLIVRKTS